MVTIVCTASVFFILTINTVITAQEEGAVITTHSGSVVNITIPQDVVGTSSIYFWTHHPNTNVSLRFTSTMHYQANFTIIQPDVWHIGYVSQPTAKTAVSISIPHGLIYTNLDYTRVRQVAVTSENLVYWAFCKNQHMCALVSPDSRVSSSRSVDRNNANNNMTKITMDITATTSSRPQYLLVSLLVLCLLFIATLVVLSIFFCCRRRSKLFHVYEKPLHPPLPPPMLPRFVIQSKNTHNSEDRDDGAPYDIPYDELQDQLSNHRRQHQHDRRLQRSHQRQHQKNRQLHRQKGRHHYDKTQLVDGSGRHLYQYDNNQLIDSSNGYLYERNNNQKIAVNDWHISEHTTQLVDTSNHQLNNTQLVDTSNQHTTTQLVDTGNRQDTNTQLVDTSNQHDTQLVDTSNRQHDDTQLVDTGDHESLNSIYGIIIR
ncbi:uncharacterized protein [Procambarus clarkii]|uniref:uncharacterized protein isoform X2 n=2 Tax=Procambarus clarkii TaxID=6728 RepID=UPI001E673236|nr:uncharacterized protein LOC123775348 isoform X2 [Procambarus clarkii]